MEKMEKSNISITYCWDILPCGLCKHTNQPCPKYIPPYNTRFEPMCCVGDTRKGGVK